MTHAPPPDPAPDEEFVPFEGDGFESPVKTWRDFWYLRVGGCLSLLVAGAVAYQTKNVFYGVGVFALVTLPLSIIYFRGK